MHGIHLHIASYPTNGATGLMELKKIGAQEIVIDGIVRQGQAESRSGAITARERREKYCGWLG